MFGPGRAAEVWFAQPSGLDIADCNNHRIAVVDWATGVVWTLIGN
jgi:hypothetical protein